MADTLKLLKHPETSAEMSQLFHMNCDIDSTLKHMVKRIAKHEECGCSKCIDQMGKTAQFLAERCRAAIVYGNAVRAGSWGYHKHDRKHGTAL